MSTQESKPQGSISTSPAPDHDAAAEKVTSPADDNDTQPQPAIDYPEGGPLAWRVVLGSWLALFGSMGLMNSLGALQSHIQRNQLSAHPPSSIAWIFGVYCGLAFFCAIQVGPVFDARGPRWLVGAGGAGTVAWLLLLGWCETYWQFMLVFGVLGGVSLALVFGPAVAIVAHYFCRRRGLATGVASSGASFGGVVWPLALQSMYGTVGFAWATRVAALMCLCTFAASLLLLRRRFPTKGLSMRRVLPDLSVFRSAGLSWTALGVFFMEWGLFVPISYLTSYALDHGLDSSFAYLLVALINAGAIPGRWLPGYLSDKFGRFNVLIITILACGLSVVCLWLTSGSSVAVLATFSIVFGFFSGSNLSLAPVCIGQLCSIESYGRYYATAQILVSISTLTSIPIAGKIFEQSDGRYQGLIIFTIGSYAASFICLIIAKIACCGLSGLLTVF